MSYVDSSRKYQFYRGDTLVGLVTIVDTDQPYFCGRIEPAEGFDDVAALLDRLGSNRRRSRSPDISGVSEEKMAARNQLAHEYALIAQELGRPGLRMVDAVTEELVFEPRDLQMDERGLWWTGPIWEEGKRII